MTRPGRNADPITMEVVRNALSSIADEMALVIMRTAYSSIVRDSMDYSTGLCDRHGAAVAHGLTMALHLGSFPDAMKALIDEYGDNTRPGDIFVFNDPYTAGGMHLPDVYIVKPLFYGGELEGYAGDPGPPDRHGRYRAGQHSGLRHGDLPGRAAHSGPENG